MYYKDEEAFKSLCGYEIDGTWYPRVTKIIEIKSKPALLYYYAQAASYAEATKQTKQSAAEGTLVHETIEKIMVGENPPIDATIAPAVNACVDFLQKNNIQVDAANVERRIMNPEHKYAGTIDALALIGGKFGVLDIKTSQSIYRDYNLQTSAYMDALIRDPLLAGLSTRWILRIDQIKNCLRCAATLRPKGGREKIRAPKSGSCPEGGHTWSELRGVIELKESPYWQEDFKAFLAAKRLWEWENEYWLKRIGFS
ncbi:MAG: hypothetical protein HYT03_00420 [Candidatus Harrisonbacteria bacterium]|nr:hypothetical protein [Candidatus Harrisonbacteria bacterium]